MSEGKGEKGKGKGEKGKGNRREAEKRRGAEKGIGFWVVLRLGVFGLEVFEFGRIR